MFICVQYGNNRNKLSKYRIKLSEFYTMFRQFIFPNCPIIINARGETENVYVVYLDVFFCVNFIMDYIVLRLTSVIAKKKVGKIRLCAGAILGAIYSVIALKFFIQHSIYLTFLNLFMLILMVFITFKFESIKVFFKNCIFMLIISIFMGGLLNYLYYSTRVGVMIQGAIHNQSLAVVNTRKFIFVTLLAYLIVSLIIAFIRKYKLDEMRYYQVKLIWRGKAVIAEALYDTGNCLTEQTTGKIVHIVQGDLIRQFGKDIENGGIYIIPFHSVGEDNGILYGIRLDEMVIERESEELHIKFPIVGIYEGELSANHKYKIILNSGVF